jgi:hypothetical protein
MTTKATTDNRSVTWEAAAQEAAFEDRCFCMLSDGRFINRHAMPDDTEHRSPFALPDAILDAILENPLRIAE